MKTMWIMATTAKKIANVEKTSWLWLPKKQLHKTALR